MPYFADFYFYKNTPMDANEVNFFNTGATNKDMATELLSRLRDYQVGAEYNSKVPFNPTATEIYINAFLNGGSGTPTIDDILAIDYMIVKAYDIHNRVTQDYKYFAYFVESIEPYMQTYPTDGLEDTGVKAAFGYSYRVKLKKDTFVTDFIFSTARISLSDIFTDGLRVNVATPIGNIYNYMDVVINDLYYSTFFNKKKNENVTTIVPRIQSQGVLESDSNNVVTQKLKLIGNLIPDRNRYSAVAVFSASYEKIAGLSHPFVCCNLPGGSVTNGYLTLEQAETIANAFMSVNHAVPENGSATQQLNIDLKYVYILPYEFVVNAFSSGVGTKYRLEAKDVAGGLNINDVYCFQDEVTDSIIYEGNITDNKWYFFEACNISVVAGRQRISLPQIINNEKFNPNKDFSKFAVKISNNRYGISIKLNLAGKSVDITDEYSLPITSSAAKDATQENIAKTSSILKGALSIVGGTIATVGGFATGNAAAGVAGIGAIVGGATGAAQTLSQEDSGGTVSVSGGNPDAISALKNGFIYFNIEPCANAVDILDCSQRYGYNFNGMNILNGAESIFSAAESDIYNFIYIEATAERFHDANGGFSKNFKAWLAERMRNGIRIFYRFEDFFNKQRNQMGYLKV